MTKHEWTEVNTLLVYLRSFEVVGHVAEYYFGNYGNDAPPSLLYEQIKVVQALLDKEQPE